MVQKCRFCGKQMVKGILMHEMHCESVHQDENQDNYLDHQDNHKRSSRTHQDNHQDKSRRNQDDFSHQDDQDENVDDRNRSSRTHQDHQDKYHQDSMEEEYMQKKSEIEPKKEEEFGCPNCNEVFAKKYKICPNCGAELSW